MGWGLWARTWGDIWVRLGGDSLRGVGGIFHGVFGGFLVITFIGGLS